MFDKIIVFHFRLNLREVVESLTDLAQDCSLEIFISFQNVVSVVNLVVDVFLYDFEDGHNFLVKK